MLTENRITINGNMERVFAAAADIMRWPEILPHYRWVKLLARQGRSLLVEMAAHRDGIPVKWTSIQEPIPEEGRILFRHVTGPVTGMEVEWLLKEEELLHGPSIQVSIAHRFDPPWPLIGSFIAEHIVGRFFIHNIAGKTLAGIKRVVEAERGKANCNGTRMPE